MARPVAAQLQAVEQPLVLAVLLPVAQLLAAQLQPVVQLPLALEPLRRRVLQQQPRPQRWVWWPLVWLLLRWWHQRLPRRMMQW